MEPGKAPASPPQIYSWLLGLLGILSFAALFTSKRNQPSESVTPHHNANRKDQNASAQAPLISNVIPTKPDESKPDRSTKRTPLWEKGAVAIAFGLLIVNIFQMRATQQAADDTHQSVMNADLNFRRDEQAWVGFALPEHYQQEYEIGTNKPLAILVPSEVVNAGKTRARKVTGSLFITVIKKGEQIALGVTKDHARYVINAGMLPAGGRQRGDFRAIKHGPKEAITIVPTVSLMRELQDGQSFLIVYGKVTYCDIFGVNHWTTFCQYASRPGFIDDDCMNYNDADNNEKPDQNSCPVT